MSEGEGSLDRITQATGRHCRDGFYDQDEAMSEGEGAEETEKRGLRGGRTAGAGGTTEGGRLVLEGLQRLRRQGCIGAFSVQSDASGDLDVRRV